MKEKNIYRYICRKFCIRMLCLPMRRKFSLVNCLGIPIREYKDDVKIARCTHVWETLGIEYHGTVGRLESG